MFHWTIVFLITAVIAAVLGFTNIAGVAIEMARIVFFISLVLWVVAALSCGVFTKKK